MQIRQRSIFTTIHVEGAILPPDLLQKIAAGNTDLKGLTPESYHLIEGEKINEAISRSWNRMLGAWIAFQQQLLKLADTDPATTITRERWLLHLFRELGYGRLSTSRSIEIEHKIYPISHLWQNVPIHLVGYYIELDQRTAGVTGAARSSPHSMIQEFINRSPDHLWAFVSNGKYLRILRDNVSLTRQAYVEFNLEAMMEGEIYSDFVLLWLLCHQSRVEAERPEEFWLEKWSKTAQEQGTRALEQLRKGVEDAITALGRGFLSHRSNQQLRDKLRDGELDKQDYYRQLLRLIYRLIFLFVAEDRNLLLITETDQKTKDTYNLYYSTFRLRQLAMKRRGSRHSDLFYGLQLVMLKLGDVKGCPELALPALGSYLFSRKAIPDLENSNIANRDLLDAIRALATITDDKTRRQVDYKNLGSEELGSVYESLLELHPDLNVDSGKFELQTAGGHERKSTGSYYTPSSLIQVLLDSALNPVLDEAAKKPDPEKAILNLKICDPACGSGHFLIAAAHRVAHRLAAIRTGEAEPAPEAIRTGLRDVVSHCIYGVDINEMAVELCKVGLWLEALEPGKPLSFLEHRIKCGNSLIGTTPVLMKNGIPDDALNPIEGDDKTICAEYKKRNKTEKLTRQMSLLDAEGLPWMQLVNLTTALTNLDGLRDDSIEGVQQKHKQYEELVNSADYLYGHLLADVWCAAFVWKKTKEFPYPITEEVYRNVERTPHSIPKWMYPEVERLRQQYKFFHWHLEYPDVFRVPAKNENPDNEQTGWYGGFDVVLGNPPWDRIKLQEKEWFSKFRTDITNASSAAKRKALIKKLENEDPYLFSKYIDAKRYIEGQNHFIRDSSLYNYTNTGELNSYAIFAEKKLNLMCSNGFVGCIIPPGIATDDTYKEFIQFLIEKQKLKAFYDFTNRGYIFQGLESTFSFALVILTNIAVKKIILAAQLWKISEITDKKLYSLGKNEIELINPNTLNLPIFISSRDAALIKNIYANVPVLDKESKKISNHWKIKLVRLYDMTNDSDLFETYEEILESGFILKDSHFYKSSKTLIPVIESKLLQSYDQRYATFQGIEKGKRFRIKAPTNKLSYKSKENPNTSFLPRYWVPKESLSERIPDFWSFSWFLGFRNAISAVADSRSVSFTIIPKTAVGNSLPLLFVENSIEKICCLYANFNSFVLDYIAKQKASGGNLNFYVLKQFPLLAETAYNNESLSFIFNRVLELTYTAWDLYGFAKDCKCETPPFRWNEDRRFTIRCELDAAYFYLYGIERNNVDYIMETFPIVKRKDEQKYGEYRTKRVILEIYDEMAEARRTGVSYKTRLDPPPADPRVAHSPSTLSKVPNL